MQAIMSTSEGDITLDLFHDAAPNTVDSFVKLANDGYYDGLTFHRIIKDFMIQGGCPLGNGTGGPEDKGYEGYPFDDEINEHKIVRGAFAMANAGTRNGKGTNGSQFFIVTTDAAPWLDGKHTVFGQVTEGIDIVDKIEALPTDGQDRPVDGALIEKVSIKETASA